MIFGVNTLPEYRKRGYAEKLINELIFEAKSKGRKGVVLTLNYKGCRSFQKARFLFYPVMYLLSKRVKTAGA